MNKLDLVQLTHANKNIPIYLTKSLIFSVYYSEGSKSTHVVANGGAVVPIKESVEDVLTKLNKEEVQT